MQEQAVERDGFRLEGVEFDLRELPFLDFAPAVHTGLGFLGFAAVQSVQELVGVVVRSSLAIAGTRQGFDGVAAQEFAPVVIEEIAGSEDVAPSDFAAVGYDDADNAFIF